MKMCHDAAVQCRTRGAAFGCVLPAGHDDEHQNRDGVTWDAGRERCAEPERLDVAIPGWEGSIGPGPGQYGKPHVYARDVTSGAGNCVCGRHLGASVHVQAAPGVPIPDRMR